jgi:hypothetical protein
MGSRAAISRKKAASNFALWAVKVLPRSRSLSSARTSTALGAARSSARVRPWMWRGPMRKNSRFRGRIRLDQRSMTVPWLSTVTTATCRTRCRPVDNPDVSTSTTAKRRSLWTLWGAAAGSMGSPYAKGARPVTTGVPLRGWRPRCVRMQRGSRGRSSSGRRRPGSAQPTHCWIRPCTARRSDWCRR